MQRLQKGVLLVPPEKILSPQDIFLPLLGYDESDPDANNYQSFSERNKFTSAAVFTTDPWELEIAARLGMTPYASPGESAKDTIDALSTLWRQYQFTFVKCTLTHESTVIQAIRALRPDVFTLFVDNPGPKPLFIWADYVRPGGSLGQISSYRDPFFLTLANGGKLTKFD